MIDRLATVASIRARSDIRRVRCPLGPTTTSAACPIDTPLAEINASPSLPLGTSGVIPAASQRLTAWEQLALVLAPDPDRL